MINGSRIKSTYKYKKEKTVQCGGRILYLWYYIFRTPVPDIIIGNHRS